MRLNREWGWILTSLVVSLSAGCNSNPAVYPVSGKVHFEGKPMQGGGSISLVPLASQDVVAAGGEIAPDGSYKLTTYAPGDGSVAGEFRVVVSQITQQEPENTGDGNTPAKATATVTAADRIPDLYADPQQSPLTAKVEAKSSNQIDFELKRKP